MTARVTTLSALALLLVACGGGETEETTPDPAGDETAGGEVEAPPVRTTTPVPVPQPAVAREALSEPLRAVWTQVEETVAIRPPEGPTEATEAAVESWAQGAFRDWVDARSAAMRELAAAGESVPDTPPHERGVAAALIAYALEDFVADVRGAPVPEGIANDEALLAIYVDNLDAVLRPLALQSVISYAYCQRRIASLGDESEWLPWRAYCVQRGRDVIGTYELEPHEMELPAANDGDGASEEPEPDAEEPTS